MAEAPGSEGLAILGRLRDTHNDEDPARPSLDLDCLI